MQVEEPRVFGKLDSKERRPCHTKKKKKTAEGNTGHIPGQPGIRRITLRGKKNRNRREEGLHHTQEPVNGIKMPADPWVFGSARGVGKNVRKSEVIKVRKDEGEKCGWGENYTQGGYRLGWGGGGGFFPRGVRGRKTEPGGHE